jgi:hypothetical protein
MRHIPAPQTLAKGDTWPAWRMDYIDGVHEDVHVLAVRWDRR